MTDFKKGTDQARAAGHLVRNGVLTRREPLPANAGAEEFARYREALEAYRLKQAGRDVSRLRKIA